MMMMGVSWGWGMGGVSEKEYGVDYDRDDDYDVDNRGTRSLSSFRSPLSSSLMSHFCNKKLFRYNFPHIVA